MGQGTRSSSGLMSRGVTFAAACHLQVSADGMTNHWGQESGMEDELVCELCSLREWVKDYCPQCVEDNLAFIRMIRPERGSLTEGSKQRILETIIAENRKLLKQKDGKDT